MFGWAQGRVPDYASAHQTNVDVVGQDPGIRVFSKRVRDEERKSDEAVFHSMWSGVTLVVASAERWARQVKYPRVKGMDAEQSGCSSQRAQPPWSSCVQLLKLNRHAPQVCIWRRRNEKCEDPAWRQCARGSGGTCVVKKWVTAFAGLARSRPNKAKAPGPGMVGNFKNCHISCGGVGISLQRYRRGVRRTQVWRLQQQK